MKSAETNGMAWVNTFTLEISYVDCVMPRGRVSGASDMSLHWGALSMVASTHLRQRIVPE
ncbi:hypothetical protein IQ256_26230 [cf. Phormidesmis sp. LEGE 11477]|nr:hypothetical protein [cf. Phormidesmis sp. LEGE 11477]